MSFDFFNKLKEELLNIDEDLYEDLEDDYENIIEVDNSYINNLTLFSQGLFLRDANEEEIIELFSKAYEEDQLKSLKILFFIRDKEKGLGERRIFRVILNYLGSINSEILKENLSLVPYYGRWDDLYALFDTKLESEAIELIKERLNMDLNSDTPTTLAKWLKSENTSSKESKQLAKRTRQLLNMTPKEYRTTLSCIRNKLNIVETSISKGNWSNIQYGNMTFKSINKYEKAFIRHDYNRYTEYKTLYKRLVGEIKERGNTLAESNSPYLYVKDLITTGNISETYEYKEYIKEYSGDTIVTIGLSQNRILKKQNIDILYGGVGTALYLIRSNRGRYKNYIITMMPKPNLKKICHHSEEEKIKEIIKSSICNEINIESALDLILFSAIKHNIKQEDIPKRLLFIFDPYCKISMLSRGNNVNMPYFINASEFERIKDKWTYANLKMPHLIFWNIDKYRENSNIVKYNDYFTYAFGYSNEVFSSLLNDKSTSTIDILNRMINNKRYSLIKELVK